MHYAKRFVVSFQHRRHIFSTVRGVLNKTLTEMFSREDILRNAVFAAIGGIIAVVILKLLEGDEGPGERAAAQREIRGENNKPEKRPQEHDERFC